VHQIRFQPGLRPGPHWGELTALLQTPSWFKVPYFLGEGSGGREERKRRGKRKRREAIPLANFWIRPWIRFSLATNVSRISHPNGV